MENLEWINKVRQYCIKYNIPVEYLPEIISDPKVIPMVRGKAFEFSVFLRLQQILPSSEWLVSKPFMNAQFGIHDMDVKVMHIATQKVISIECKLAGKGTFRVLKNGNSQIKVKCMRSRTLGESKVKELAPKLNIPESLLQVHNDQYVTSDFDIVITSIANAFYETDAETDLFEWQPTEKAITFLQNISELTNSEDLQHFAYNKMYVASSESLAIKENNNITCTRKGCTKLQNCGFIPNYPLITFENGNKKPNNAWFEIENCELLFKSMIEKSK